MIVFPVLNSLTLEQYGLYPPSSQGPFRIEFLPGPTAIVGVNGSGKTTLINMALHCLTGPFNLPAVDCWTELLKRLLCGARGNPDSSSCSKSGNSVDTSGGKLDALQKRVLR